MDGMRLGYGLLCLTPLSTIFQWWSVLLVEETGLSGENHRPATKLMNFIP